MSEQFMKGISEINFTLLASCLLVFLFLYSYLDTNHLLASFVITQAATEAIWLLMKDST